MLLVSWLQSRIAAAGLSQAEFGRRVGWSEVVVSRILKGNRTLRADELVQALDYFGWPMPTGDDRLAELVRLAHRLDADDLSHVIRLAERLGRGSDRQ